MESVAVRVNGLFDAGIGIGRILDAERLGEVVLQAIGTLPGELLVVGRLDDHQSGALVTEHSLFKISIDFGGEVEVFGQVIEIEIVENLPVFAFESLHLFEWFDRLGLNAVVVGEAATVLVFAEVLDLVVGRPLTRIGIREGEILEIVDVRFQGLFTHTVFSDVRQRQVGGAAATLSHHPHAVAFLFGAVGPQIVFEQDIGIVGVVFWAANLAVIIKI